MSLLRPITPADHAEVLALNERHVELLGLADRAAVIEHGGGFAGFVLTFRSGTAYDSVNYRWFTERYGDFYYLDRVVVHESYRRLGLGSQVYDELEAHGRQLASVLALEVNLDPPNDASLAFHRGRGYTRVGEQEAGGHVVELMVKRLR